MSKIFIYLLVFSFLTLPTAQAANESLNLAGKKTTVVAKAAAFGAGGGLIVGLASQVVKKKAKNIFLFGSLGLYTGIAMGIYLVTAPKGSTPYEGPDTYDDYGEYSSTSIAPEREQMKLANAKADSAEVSILNVSF